MEILSKILGNSARVKIMRLFLLNRGKAFSSKEIARRSQVSPTITGQELRLLASVNFLKKRPKDWIFNPAFKYAAEMEGLLVSSDSINTEGILDMFKKVGRVKLLILSGVLIKNHDSRVDLLVVGDNMKKGKIDETMKKLEAELGTELVYAVFNTKEFIYRVNMYDKLVRDILDYPHEVVLQDKRLSELSTQALKKS